MFSLSRERDEIAGPPTSSRQSDSPLPSHHPEAPPKDEWPLASSIREQDYEIYGLYCADPSTSWTQQTQTTFEIPPLSRILDDDGCERLAKKPSFTNTPYGRDKKNLRTNPVHSLPDPCAAAEDSHEHEHAPLYLEITPPPCSPYNSAEDGRPESTGPGTPKQYSVSHRMKTSSKPSCLQTPGRVRHSNLLVQEPTHCDPRNSTLCCCDEFINSAVSFQSASPCFGHSAALSNICPDMTLHMDAPRRSLDGALARLNASLNRERRQRSSDGLPVQGKSIRSNISFTSRLIPRNLLNLESGWSSWIGNVYCQAAEWIVDVRIVVIFSNCV